MKAIRFLLATLIIGAGAGFLACTTTAYSTGVERADATELWGSGTRVTPNILSKYIWVDMINFKENKLSVQMIYPGMEWRVKYVAFYQRDYRAGITEQDDGLRLAALGTGQGEDWAVKLFEGKAEVPQDSGVQLEAVKEDGLKKNLTDQLYYVMIYDRYNTAEDGTKSWKNEELVARGKLDYRSCVHALGFDAEMMYCGREDAGGNKLFYQAMTQFNGTSANLPTSPILTWEEEWNAAQTQILQEENAGLKVDLAAAQAREEKLGEKLSEVEGQLTEVKEQLTEVKNTNEELKTKLTEAEAENQRLLAKIADLEQKLGATPAENAPRSDVEAASALETPQSLSTAVSRETAAIGAVRGLVGDAGSGFGGSANSGLSEVATLSAPSASEKAAASVEVPKLGQTETRNGQIWFAPAIGALALAGGFGVIGAKKAKKRF